MEDPFEAQGVFKDGNLIAAWSMNDADYRSEYFNGFMNKLGIKVTTKRASLEEKRAIGKWFGATKRELESYKDDE